MQNLDQHDPRQILLNFTGFRSKFHIYELLYDYDKQTKEMVYIVRKQLLGGSSLDTMQEVVRSEKHVELVVQRCDVERVYDLLPRLSVPVNRTSWPGKDGGWFALRVGMKPCSTVFRWWSDNEPELAPIYKLRDQIVKTVKEIIRKAKR
jgi:hypothetical protein